MKTLNQNQLLDERIKLLKLKHDMKVIVLVKL